MKYLLDSNILIEHLLGRYDLAPKLLDVGRAACAIPTIAPYEILHGGMRSSKPKEMDRVRSLLHNFEWVAFDADSAEVTAKLRFELEALGQRIGPHDLMIAGIAIAHGFTLVTHNLREFGRVPGIKLEDWQAES